MLNYYYLYSDEAPKDGNFDMLKEINIIPEVYVKKHPKRPWIKTAEQVVVNNQGNVNHNSDSDNGQKYI